MLPAGLVAGLEAALNRYLALDPGAVARLGALQGRQIALELRGLDLMTLTVSPGTRGITLTTTPEASPDVVLRGTPLGMARLGLGKGTATSPFSGNIEITGDVETGQAFKAILDELDIDWEEQLSKLTGDVIAHQLGNAARHVGRTAERTHSTLEKNLGEYLQEELRVLPARVEIKNFLADIEQLSTDVQQLADRIRQLQAAGTS